LKKVRKTRTTSYRTCSNGIIEKCNGTLEKMIRCFVNKNASNWDSYIGIVMSAYRSKNSSLDQNESLRGFHNGQYIHEPISQQLSQLVGLEVGTLPSNE
jgi:hypothetical protein